MKKFMITSAMFMAVFSAHAQTIPQITNDFRQNGVIGAPANLDFQMDFEADRDKQELYHMAAGAYAAAAALAACPEGDGVLGVAAGHNKDRGAIASCYSKDVSDKLRIKGNVSLGDSTLGATVGFGAGFKF